MRAAFVERPNRFLVIAGAGRRRLRAASRDPGRLRELLRPGAKLLLVRSSDPRRRTGYTVALVRHAGAWVSLVPVLANRILEAALERDAAPGLEGARVLRREPSSGRSRLDFVLQHEGRQVLTEVKSATLVERGLALFPDAPSTRGARHVRELTAWQRRGGRSLVVFVVQRSDARRLSPHAGNDPEFERALAEAARAGVRILAYTCRVGPEGCALDRRIPVVIRGRRIAS